MLPFVFALATAFAAQGQVGLQLPSPTAPRFDFARSPAVPLAQLPISSSLAPATPQLPRTPAAYRYQDLAFFCRVEVKLEQAATLPVKFRLGSVNYVDRLEGKGF